MATEVASLFGTLRLNDGQFTRGLQRADRGLSGLSGALSGVTTVAVGVGAALGTALAGAGAASIKFGMDFEHGMTNAFAILQPTTEQASKLRREVLRLGTDAVAGPQAVGEAYYTIVSGVQDATTHMDILSAAVATSEAGNASLAATTDGLVSVMNAYGLEAEDAEKVSNTLTQTVGMGVGTMDQFVGALGPASGLAYDLGISFEELSAATAFLTSTGSSAAESVTQLEAIMSAFLKPNKDMEEALQELGYANGEAAIEALGLQGAVDALYGVLGDNSSVAKALGTQEALSGAVGLNNERYDEFFQTYMDGLDGATERAREIQRNSPINALKRLAGAAKSVGIVFSMEFAQPIGKALNRAADAVGMFGQQVLQARDTGLGFFHIFEDGSTYLDDVFVALGFGEERAMALGRAVVSAGQQIQQTFSVIRSAFHGVVQQFQLARDTGLGFFHIFEDGSTRIGGVLAALGMAEERAMALGRAVVSAGQQIQQIFQVIRSAFHGVVQQFQLARDTGLGFFHIFEDGSTRIGGILAALGMAEERAMALGRAFVNATTATGAFLLDIAPMATFIGGLVASAGVMIGVFNVGAIAVKGLAAAFAILTSPAVLLTGAIAGIVYAAHKLYPGGLSQMFTDAMVTAQMLTDLGIAVLTAATNVATNAISRMITTVVDWKTKFEAWYKAISPLLDGFKAWFVTDGLPQAMNKIKAFKSGFAAAFRAVRAEIQKLINKFNEVKANIDEFVTKVQSIEMPDLRFNPFGGTRAEGGPVERGTPYLVGERGPELFVPSGSGDIMSNKDTAAAMGSAGNTFHITINAAAGANGRDLARQFRDEITRRGL